LTTKGLSFISHATPLVFVVDDVSVRESLELLIRCEGRRPETFASALDVSLPGLSGLDLQKHVAVERPDMPIVFYH